MKETLLGIVNSEMFWLGVTALIGYAANSIVSRGLLAKLPPTNPLRRLVRALHGFLNKIDPAALALMIGVTLTVNGCSGGLGRVTGEIVDGAVDLCKSDLVKVTEVIAEADRRGAVLADVVAGFCQIADVVDVYTVKPGEPRKLAPRSVQAVEVLRSKGELQ